MSAGDTMAGLTIHGANLTRRGFIAAGGAMVAILALRPQIALATDGSTLDPAQSSAWIEILADNNIRIRTGKCDFGQSSIYTAYRQIVAEELGVPLSAMTEVVSGDTDRTPDGGGTFGLLRYSQNLRKVAALMREAAFELAATRFGIDRSELAVADGIIAGGGQQITYGELVTGQDLRLTIPVTGDLTMPIGLFVLGDPPLKPRSAYTIVGQPATNPTLAPKISGETVWVGDVKLPGMLHARVVHPATLGSTLVSAGEVDATRYPGARVVVIGNLVAVASSDEWEAIGAAQQVASSTTWTQWAGLPPSEQLISHMRDAIDWSIVPPTNGRANQGDPAGVTGGRVHEAGYAMPFQKHAPISPMVTLADCASDGSVTLHTHSQNPQHLRRMIALMLETGEDKVVVRTYPGSGHYGRSNGGSAGSEDEAVLLSRELGRPVRVQWMRADDMQWSSQSPAMISDIRITLDNAGKIAAYQATHRGPPMQDDRLIGAVLAGLPAIPAPAPEETYGFQSGMLNVYDAWVYGEVANVAESGIGTTQIGQAESPLAIGLRDHSMRTPIQFQQNFPREVAFSEAAMLAGSDPLQFRLDHVTDPRLRIVLQRLRAEARWEARAAPSPSASATGSQARHGQGVSVMLRDNGYWACAARVAVTPETGAVRVEHITIVADVGIIVNPLQLRRQVQAGCLMGVSQALHEEASFDEGAITSTNWASYPILKMNEMPELTVVLLEHDSASVYGQGSESANALAAPAIAAAVMDATGKPIRRLPLRPANVLQALAG